MPAAAKQQVADLVRDDATEDHVQPQRALVKACAVVVVHAGQAWKNGESEKIPSSIVIVDEESPSVDSRRRVRKYPQPYIYFPPTFLARALGGGVSVSHRAVAPVHA